MQAYHMSIDDVSKSLHQCADKSQPFMSSILFRYLDRLHNRYGLKISLYIQNWSEFEKCDYLFEGMDTSVCKWMRFGIHTTAEGLTFDKIDYDEAKSLGDRFYQMIINNQGTKELIDIFPRLHMFAGSKDALRGLHDSKSGIRGLLTADDSRISYYFDKTFDNICRQSAAPVYDADSGIYFKKTDMRLDWFAPSFKSNYTYNKPAAKSPYNELKTYANLSGGSGIIIIFTHEWQIFNNLGLKEKLSRILLRINCDAKEPPCNLSRRKCWIEDVCRYVHDNNGSFLFPEEFSDSETKQTNLRYQINEIK